jgi:ammonium transporter, Amt family
MSWDRVYSVSVLSESTQSLCAALILVIPLAAAGLALTHAGLGRSRSAAQAMVAAVCVTATAALAYFVCGWSWQGYPGQPAHAFRAAGRVWNWIGAEPFFLGGLGHEGSLETLTACSQMFSVGIAGLIPLGAGNDRWRLGASCASTALLAGWTYPLFAHWVWGGGWLAQLGVNPGWGHGLLDVGGAGAIQAVGGLTAFSIASILGPRHRKYAADGMPTAIPAHNVVLVLFACFLTWIGWIGLNGSGCLLRIGGSAAGVAMVAINTTLSAAASALAAACVTRIRFGKPDASLIVNGWTGGLVASSASCGFVTPGSAAITGAIAGVLIVFSAEWLDARFGVDDPAGSISVHAVGGLWGVLALGFFARIPKEWAINGSGTGNSNQWLAQLAGIAALIAFVLPMTHALNHVLNRFYPQRVSAEGEADGLDLDELGAGAYPEFVVQREDLRPR